MAEESNGLDSTIPTAEERTTNATPVGEWGQGKPKVRQAVPFAEYNLMKRRDFIEKSAISIGGILAAAAGMIGLSKIFERAWFSKEPGIEAGRDAARQNQNIQRRESPPVQIPSQIFKKT